MQHLRITVIALAVSIGACQLSFTDHHGALGEPDLDGGVVDNPCGSNATLAPDGGVICPNDAGPGPVPAPDGGLGSGSGVPVDAGQFPDAP